MATETRDEILGDAWEIIYDLIPNYTTDKWWKLYVLISDWNLIYYWNNDVKIFLKHERISDDCVRIYIEDDYVDCKIKNYEDCKIKKKR